MARHVLVLTVLRWLSPHLTIWSVAALYARNVLGTGGCSGLCGVSTGITLYSVLIASALFSTLVAAIQLALVARHLDVGADRRQQFRTHQ